MDNNSNYSKVEHLKMVQNIISRLAGNSSNIKKYTITILSGFIGGYIFFIDKDAISNKSLLTIIFICITVFLAIFDAYYLYLERSFVARYNEIAGRKETNDKNYNFKMIPLKEKVNFLDTLFSLSIGLFYLPIIIVVIVLFYFY